MYSYILSIDDAGYCSGSNMSMSDIHARIAYYRDLFGDRVRVTVTETIGD